MTRIAIAASLLLLAACGGGGGSSTPVIVVPSPMPAPSPTPTASPTPTPSPSYAIAFDFARDRSFEAIGATLTSFYVTTPAPPTYTDIATMLQDDGAGVRINYAAADRSVALSFGLGAPIVYAGSTIAGQEDDRLFYTRDDGFLSVGQPGPRLGSFPDRLNYVLLVVQDQSGLSPSPNGVQLTERRYLIGSPTLPTDVPTSGAISYRSLLTAASQTATVANAYARADADISVDYAGRTLVGTVTAQSTSSSAPPAALTLTFTGQVATGGRVVGSITGPDGASGTFTGKLYGPAGVEIGLAFVATRGNERLIGTLVGKRR